MVDQNQFFSSLLALGLWRGRLALAAIRSSGKTSTEGLLALIERVSSIQCRCNLLHMRQLFCSEDPGWPDVPEDLETCATILHRACSCILWR